MATTAWTRLVADIRNVPMVFPPGETFSYSNAGFVVLGRIVEVLRGMSWDTAFRTHIVEPLGLDHTVTLPEEALRYRTACGHTFDSAFQLQLASVWSGPRAMAPSGSTPCANAEGLLAFGNMHLSGGTAPGGARLLSEGSVRAMQSVQIHMPPTPWEQPNAWGLGWQLFDWAGRRVIGHDGGTDGQLSRLRVVPEIGFGVAALTNARPSGGFLLNRATRWLFQAVGIELPPRPAPPEMPVTLDLTPYVGTYEQSGFRLEITEGASGLTMRTHATGPADSVTPVMQTDKLIPVEPGLFLAHNPLMQVYTPVRFSGWETGRAKWMSMSRIARRVQ